jgi:hypothetical protein
MNIDRSYPTPKQLIANEIKTIEFLKDKTQIREYYPQLYTDASTYHSRNYREIQSRTLRQFIFESHVDIMLNRRKGTCYIGAKITTIGNRYDCHSYFIALRKVENLRLLRKYHFDYTACGVPHRQPHPVFHIQYPGELSPKLEELSLVDRHLDSWLSEPRLSYTPMSLALLINLAFKEFPSEHSMKFIEMSEWRDLIRINEKLLLEPYYLDFHRFIISSHTNRLITNDYCYGT